MALKQTTVYEDRRGMLHKNKKQAELAEAEYDVHDLLIETFGMIIPSNRDRFISVLSNEHLKIMQRYLKLHAQFVDNTSSVEEV